MIWWRHNQYRTYLFRFWLYICFFPLAQSHYFVTFILCHFGFPSVPHLLSLSPSLSPLHQFELSLLFQNIFHKSFWIATVLKKKEKTKETKIENQQWFACNWSLLFIYRSFVIFGEITSGFIASEMELLFRLLNHILDYFIEKIDDDMYH